MDWLTQLGAVPLPPEEQERQIENLLLHRQVSEKTRDLISQQLAGVPPQPLQQGTAKPVAISQAHQAADRDAALTAGLLFGSPDFQRR